MKYIFKIMVVIISVINPTISICQIDTLPPLSIKFQYFHDKNVDSYMNQELLKSQKLFLEKNGLPTKNSDFIFVKNQINIGAIDSLYNEKLNLLNENKFKDLYRQIASQIICVFLVGKNKKVDKDKIIFYMNEMESSGGTNPRLFASCLLSLEKVCTLADMCEHYSNYTRISIEYLTDRKDKILENKKELMFLENKQLKENFFKAMDDDLSRDEDTINYLISVKSKFCK